MGPRVQVWVSRSSGAPLIISMGNPFDIMRMLAVLLSGTQMILPSGTNDEQSNHSNQRPQHRNWTREDNKLYTVILGATLQKESIEKE